MSPIFVERWKDMVDHLGYPQKALEFLPGSSLLQEPLLRVWSCLLIRERGSSLGDLGKELPRMAYGSVGGPGKEGLEGVQVLGGQC
jgi:hypothetical protein